MIALSLLDRARVALAVALLFAAGSAWAMPPMGGDGAGEFAGELFFVERMAQRLQLSDDQRAQVEAVMAAQRKQARPYVKVLVQSRRELRQASRAETFDEAAVRAIAERQAKAMTEMTVLRLRGRHAVRELLTPDQRQRMHHPKGERSGHGHGDETRP